MTFENSPQPQNAPHPYLAAPIATLIEQLNKLPGIGPKSAQRLAYYLIRISSEESESLAAAIHGLKDKITFCGKCHNIAERNPCQICTNPDRDQQSVCVVQEPLDVLAIERTLAFKGLYHVLHGVIDPMRNVGPHDLRIKELLERIPAERLSEVVLATNPTIEGEATALYIHRLLAPLGPKVTRLARGLPVGGDLEYADDLTLARAFEGRQAL